jgi:hypothetical protein
MRKTPRSKTATPVLEQVLQTGELYSFKHGYVTKPKSVRKKTGGGRKSAKRIYFCSFALQNYTPGRGRYGGNPRRGGSVRPA